MNSILLQLVRETGYLSDAPLTAQQRFDLLTPKFWWAAKAAGYEVATLKRILWRVSGRPEEALIASLPEAPIQTVIKAQEKEKDPRKRIKETAILIALLYKKGEKEIRAAIDDNLEYPDRMRAETGRIRRNLLAQAASWLGVAVPGMYLAGSKAGTLQGPHARAAQAMAAQEFNRFKEIDSTIGRHIEEIISEAEKRRAQHTLSQSQAKIDYSGLKGRIVGHKTIDGKNLSLSDYVSMIATMAARNSFNEGVSNFIIGNGDDLAIISREVRANSCQACREWAGRTISISGKSKEYPSLKDAEDARVFHVHCIHTLTPIDYAGST